MRSLVIGIALLFLDFNEARAASFFDGQTCYVSRGYESLEKLNQDQAQIRMCQSEKSSCYAVTGFGQGEVYPFDYRNETESYGSNDKDVNNDCDDWQFACSSSGNYSGSRECIPGYYLCDGDNDCDDGSDEYHEFCMQRWGEEEFGKYGCLGQDRPDRIFGSLFKGFNKRRTEFLDQVFAFGKGKVDVSLSGAHLTGSATTDFKSVMNKISQELPQEVKGHLVIKIDDFTAKLKINGDFTAAYKAFEKMVSRRWYRMEFTDILDTFDGILTNIDQSISGNVDATYKKVKTLAKWIFANGKSCRGPPTEECQWTSYIGERINVDAKLKLSVGESNAAEMTFTGEATEAAKTFIQNGMFASLNGNVEFCQDRKCNRVMLCNTDLCNKFEPQQWETVHEYDCPAEQWRNEQGGCQDCECSKSGSTGNECNKQTGQCNCKPGVIGRNCGSCPPQSIFFVNESLKLQRGSSAPKGLFEDEDEFSQNQRWSNFGWLDQFDYTEGCFSCHSIQECKTSDKIDCPSACRNL